MECSICKGEIENQLDQDGNVFWDQGNNAEPVNDGRCCGECNMTVVIPTRIGLITKQ